jgi:hypothetical protein
LSIYYVFQASRFYVSYGWKKLSSDHTLEIGLLLMMEYLTQQSSWESPGTLIEIVFSFSSPFPVITSIFKGNLA